MSTLLGFDPDFVPFCRLFQLRLPPPYDWLILIGIIVYASKLAKNGVLS